MTDRDNSIGGTFTPTIAAGAAGTVDSAPFCGSCGYDIGSPPDTDTGDDWVCDACGAPFLAYNWAGNRPPTDLSIAAGTPATTVAVATFTPNAGAVNSSLRYRVRTSSVWTEVDPYTSGADVTGLTLNTEYVFQVRSNTETAGAKKGPWSPEVPYTTAAS